MARLSRALGKLGGASPVLIEANWRHLYAAFSTAASQPVSRAHSYTRTHGHPTACLSISIGVTVDGGAGFVNEFALAPFLLDILRLLLGRLLELQLPFGWRIGVAFTKAHSTAWPMISLGPPLCETQSRRDGINSLAHSSAELSLLHH